jgi:hypothetical protein
MSKVNINEVKKGDIFSESSYYRVESINSDSIDMKMVGTDKIVNLSKSYAEQFLNTADQYDKEVKVGILDKFWTVKKIEEATKKGTLPAGVKENDLQQEGMKTIWGKIGPQAITVCFIKKDESLSDKAYNQLVTLKAAEAVEAIEATKTAKKGVANKAAQVIEEIIRNPISRTIPGLERVLRGYKVQFESEDGYYQMTEIDKDGIVQMRPVNLNTMQWAVVDGVKYIKE